MKRIILCMLILLLPVQVMALGFENIEYHEDVYQIVAIENDGIMVLDEASSFQNANVIYNRLVNDYANIGITKEGSFYKVKYGIVQFKTTSACDYNVEFTNAGDNKDNYINGCYGNDGAYIDTDIYAGIEFEISGVKGWADFSDATIIPLEFLSDNAYSSYTVTNGLLYHQVKGNVYSEYYLSLINLGEAPDFLDEDKVYYSYDGHYYYDDIRVLLDDLRNDSTAMSLNEAPYYNYYQFISHRTSTNIDITSMTSYFYDTLGIDSKLVDYEDLDEDSTDDSFTRSQYYDDLDVFYEYQNVYGANAVMMIALSMNESAYGRSALSYNRNNIFGHAAYDKDVESNASRYLSVVSSIYSHAKYYISGTYSYPERFQYHGSYFGNKASGMNVSYASDPYWGEKAAQYYYKLDKANGSLDLNSNEIGVAEGSSSIKILEEPYNNSNVLYTETGEDLCFVILDAFENGDGSWYKIQCDATLNDDNKVDLIYTYDMEKDVAYIPQSECDYVFNECADDSAYFTVTFDSNGGIFRTGDSVISYKMKKGVASMEDPSKDGYLFTGWDKELSLIDSDTTYTAIYKKVVSIEMENTPLTIYETNEKISLKNGSILITFEDGSTQSESLDTTMISDFDMASEGDQEVIVTYAGMTTSYVISVSAGLEEERESIKASVVSMIADCDETQFADLHDQLMEYMPSLTFNEYRALDKLYYDHYRDVQYHLPDNELDLEVTGLSTILPLEESVDKSWKDIYYVTYKKDYSEILDKVALGYEYTIAEGFTLGLKRNLKEYETDGRLLLSIAKPEDTKNSDVYTVLMLKDGEEVKLKTIQTADRIVFMSEGFGEYCVVYKSSSNIYDDEDVTETITLENDNKDKYLYLFSGSGAACILAFGLVYFIRKKGKNNDIKKTAASKTEVSEDGSGQQSAE